jgi:hypothetical protein
MRLLGSDDSSSTGGLQLLLIPAFGLALLALLAAVAPARALPRQANAILDGRRDSIAYTVITVLLAFLIALLIAHVGS